VEHHQIIAYGIIFLGLLLEGELFLICTGILVHLGALNIWVSLAVVILGVLSKPLVGYELGVFLFKIFNHHKFFKYIQRRVYSILPRFKTKPFWSIFASKFIVGANNIVIIFSGFERIDYKKFLKADLSATAIWAPFMLLLGYIFSYTALQVSKEIWQFLVVILLLYAVFIIFDKLISWLYELTEEPYEENN
jgi:membrane protein DedA with SNARE-associated domain